MIIIMIIINF